MSAIVLALSTQSLFLLLVGLVAAERLLEMRRAARNERLLAEQGALRVRPDAYPLIVAAHVLWFGGLLAETTFAPWAGMHAYTALLLAAFIGADVLRYWAMLTLGERWTTRVVVVPGARRVRRGPYRLLDHPNYVAVTILLAALPLAFGAYATAVGVSLLNAFALRRRTAVEGAALAAAEEETLPSPATANVEGA